MDLLAHAHEIPQVAATAAAIYGQNWDALPGHSRQRWLEAIRDAVTTVNGLGTGQTLLEQAACQAVQEWQETKRLSQIVIEVATVPRTPIKKAPVDKTTTKAAKKGKR